MNQTPFDNIGELKSILVTCESCLQQSTSQSRFLNKICELLVLEREYPLLWLGLSRPEEVSIFPEVIQGSAQSFLSNQESPLDQKFLKFIGGNKSILLADLKEETCIPDFWTKLPENNVQSALILPLLRTSKNRPSGIWGMLCIFQNSPQSLTDNEIQMLEEISHILVQGLDKQWPESQEQESRELLRPNPDLWRSLVEYSPAWIISINLDGVILFVNREFLGQAPELHIGANLYDLVSPESQANLRQAGEVVYNTLTTETCIFSAMKGEELSYYQCNIGPLTSVGEVEALILIAISQTEIKEAEEELRLHTRILENLGEGVILIRADTGRIIYTNPRFNQLFGYLPDELLNKPGSILNNPHKKNINKETQDIIKILQKTGRWNGETENIKKDGNIFLCQASISSFQHSRFGTVWVSVNKDITERKQAEEVILHQAFHDGLTGLANRTLLMERLQQELKRAGREKSRLAVLFLDLDRFKNINDSLGHSVGDLVIRLSAARIESCLRKSDTVARQGGDEFIILLPNIKSLHDPVAISEKILESLAEAFPYEGQQLFVSGSVGIAIFPENGREADVLLKNADAAMYAAKSEGRNTYRYYTHTLNLKAREKLDMEALLHRALENQEFRLKYQPRINIITGTLTGIEAHLHWEAPGTGQIPVSRFLPIAEETGLIRPLGEWTLEQACRVLPDFQYHLNLPDLPMSVWLSSQHFKQEDIFEKVLEITNTANISPNSLEIATSENLLAKDIDSLKKTLDNFSNLGVRISIHGFGSGFSSLSRLNQLPIHSLKIDSSLIQNISDNPDDQVLIPAIIAMARSMNILSIATGVESQSQHDFLKSAECDELTGPFHCPPLNHDELLKFLGKI